MDEVALEQPVKKRRLLRKILLTLVLLFLAFMLFVLAFNWRIAYKEVQPQLTEYHGIRIGMTRQEVRYVLGSPTHVLGKAVFDKQVGDKIEPVYQVDGQDPINKLLPGTGINDYHAWQYSKDSQYYQVDYDGSGRVTDVTCWSDYKTDDGFCETLVGVNKNDTEEDVFARLGQPDRQKFSDEVKIASWDGLGVRIAFARKKAYQLGKAAPQFSTARAVWALHGW